MFGIKCNISLGNAMRMHQIYKLFEQFIFSVASFYLFLCEEPLHLVVSIKEEDLKQVLGDGIPELVG